MDPAMTAEELRAALRSGELRAVEAAQFYRERIEKHDADLNAFVWMDREDVIRRARADFNPFGALTGCSLVVHLGCSVSSHLVDQL